MNGVYVLIELFDAYAPMFNVLSAAVLRPERIVVLGDAKIERQKYRKPMMNFLMSAGLTADVRFVKCSLYDVGDIERGLEGLMAEYGEDACVIDVTGGSETLLLAVGKCCLNRNIRAIMNKPGSNRMKWLSGPDAGNDIAYDVQISVQQSIMLAGGELMHPEDTSMEDTAYDARETILRVFRVFMKHRKQWPLFVQYLQLVNRPENTRDDLLIAPASAQCHAHALRADMGILGALTEAGAMMDVRYNSRECAFRFASSEIGHWLCDAGIWLELYLFAVMRRSGLFDSLKLRAVVSWDDDEDSDDVLNEIDIMATAGIGQVLIACKTGVPNPRAISEIAVLAHRFGTRYTTTVLAMTCDVKREMPSMIRRAAEMGVEILDREDLDERALEARLRVYKQRWDRA